LGSGSLKYLERLASAQFGPDAVEQVEQLRVDHADIAGVMVAQEVIELAQRLRQIVSASRIDQAQPFAGVRVVQRQAALARG